MARYVPLLAGLITTLLVLPRTLHAAGPTLPTLDLTLHPVGFAGLAVFTVAYLVVMSEEFTQLRKSKPMVLGAGLLWAMVALMYSARGDYQVVEAALRHNTLEFAELFLFLLVAMTYINALDERQAFNALRAWLVRRNFSYRGLFWLTGVLSFCLSPVADNLTTGLVMCAVLLAVGAHNPRFVGLGCVNVVVAANSGGAFSPFGDITTLMVWQKGIMGFFEFFALFLPSLVNWLVPAAVMQFAVPRGVPPAVEEKVTLRFGARRIMLLFMLSIVTAVSFHQFLHLPPYLGMMVGLAYLQFFAYYIKKRRPPPPLPRRRLEDRMDGNVLPGEEIAFDIFRRIARAEWDTLLFFFGVIHCVGALGFMGYLGLTSGYLYGELGPTVANILVGVLSAIVDNIPVMFAVLTMNPDLSQGQWLLVTLTAGVGGSMLSIGSAAGVALMGQARGKYTFFTHLKWTPVIALGYAASIAVHMWVNQAKF